jgi:glycyl-tRNA synthetase
MQGRLAQLTFETRLGSVADRAARIASIATSIARHLNLPEGEQGTLERAAGLAKFDLGSAMVTELSSLAGVMAREYASHAGEPAAVAEALFEMELPRHAGDALPFSRPGAILALADRLDLLAGLFAIGAEPTGSSDPFGLRRAALGLLAILRAHPGVSQLTINDGLAIAAAAQPIPASSRLEDALDSIARRFDQLMLDQGHPAASIRAVKPLVNTPARAEQALHQLTTLLHAPQGQELVAAVQRARRIVPAGTTPGFSPALFDSPAEHALQAALSKASDATDLGTTLQDFASQATTLIEPVNAFFDQVLVMADDPAVKANRLGLLASVYHLAEHYLDWAQLP